MVKNLGSNEKRVRDRAIKSLKKYFSSDKIQFTDLDFAKLWKGLFYSTIHQKKQFFFIFDFCLLLFIIIIY